MVSFKEEFVITMGYLARWWNLLCEVFNQGGYSDTAIYFGTDKI
jgi:hypothetical protein